MTHPLGELALLVPDASAAPAPGQLEELERELTGLGVSHHRVDLGDQPRETVAAELAAGVGFLVACGTQDVVTSILPALVDPAAGPPGETVLGLFPGGRTHDFAHTFGLGLAPDAAAELLAGPRVMRIDIGVADVATRMGRQQLLVLNEAVIGLGARVAARTAGAPATGVRRLLAWWTTTATYRRPAVDIDMTFADWHGDLVQANLANGQYSLAHLHTAPMALPDDGAWDVQVWSGPRHLPFTLQTAMVRGEHLPNEHVSMWRHSRVEVTPRRASHRVPIAIDGAFAGYAPATFTLLPKALRLKI